MPRAVLIGPPGAGKSSVARQLGRILDCPVVDTDSVIEKKSGKTISEIFVEDGETKFREIEREVVLDEIKNNEIGNCFRGFLKTRHAVKSGGDREAEIC